MAPPRPDKPAATPRPQAFYAPPPKASVVPLARPLGESLARDDGLASLLARVRASQARLDALADVLPGLLRQHLRAGPLDDDGWTILAAKFGRRVQAAPPAAHARGNARGERVAGYFNPRQGSIDASPSQ